VSEQISTAGMEASGTGNMKLAMNGALTLGTRDGANIEIMQAVGPSNFYAFGLTPQEVSWYREKGSYNPRELYAENPVLRRVMDSLASDRFCPDEHGLFRWIVDEILERGDRYFHMADLGPYIEASARVAADYRDVSLWATKSILNVARVGFFSSDRTIREYARDIWHIEPVTPAQESLPERPKESLSAEMSR
jgi:glycogen phosphorylase